MTPNEYLDAIAELIQARAACEDKAERGQALDVIMFNIANALRVYCKQQGHNCEACRFVLQDPDRKACECRINIGKNAPGTAPRFWELMEKRDHEDKERIDTDGQLGKVLPVREEGA